VKQAIPVNGRFSILMDRKSHGLRPVFAKKPLTATRSNTLNRRRDVVEKCVKDSWEMTICHQRRNDEQLPPADVYIGWLELYGRC